MNHEHTYRRLAFMVILSFASMYALMYAMVNVLDNAVPNLNQTYMAGLMTMPMVLIELLLMKGMYRNRSLNRWILGLSILALIFFWIGIRRQVAIGDEQFLKSMIPHHAGAILMCQQASLQDPEVQKLCRNIISGQQAEIDFMRAKLESIR